MEQAREDLRKSKSQILFSEGANFQSEQRHVGEVMEGAFAQPTQE
jgi:hypothetical protein